MMKVETVPFLAEHATAVLEAGILLDEGQDWTAQAKIMEEAGSCVTLLDENSEPVLCMGVITIWKGCGEAWLLGSNKMSKHPIAIARAIKEVFFEYVEHKGFWRVQSNVRCDWPLAIKFIKFMGMEKEGLMKKFGPEEADYYRFAWVK
tara:strand:+ start:562 stop:1005 length:444 start_codon:yes stop_codon:yes gene_type:complete